MEEKFIRKKSGRSFGRELISECLDSRDKDVIIRCSDGDMSFNRLYLGLISAVLQRILSQCHYSSMHQILILMPDWSRSEVKRLRRLHQEEVVSRSSLLDTLSIMKQYSLHNNTSRGKINCSLLDKRYSSTAYDSTIQDLSNIDSLDLFDPLYLEEVEIQNEENLSLTIHSNDLDVIPPPSKKLKPKKTKLKLKTKRVKNVKQEKNMKAIEVNNSASDKPKNENNNKVTMKDIKQEKKQSDSSKKRIDTCSKCDKTAKVKKQKKGDNKNLNCHLCSKKFKIQRHLQDHLRIHSGEKPFICHTCGKSFNQEAALRVHLRIHTGQKPHECPECDQTFTIRASLVSHIQWRHKSGERPFLCSFCSKSFPTKGAVRKHETIHKQDKKYGCSYCDKKYARPDHLKSHMKTHKNIAVLMLDVVEQKQHPQCRT